MVGQYYLEKRFARGTGFEQVRKVKPQEVKAGDAK